MTIVASPSGCPSPAQLADALAQFVPTRAVRIGNESGGALPVVVVDLETRYRVSVAGAEREFNDRARRCEERAEAAAVFVSLTLDPPADQRGGADVAPAAVSVTRPASEPRSASAFVHLEMAGLVAAAPPGGQAALVSGGGSLRLAAGWRFVGIELGATGLAPSKLLLGEGAAVRLLRFPVDVGVRLQKRWPSLDLVFDFGLCVTVVRLDGVGLARPSGATVLDAGLRSALEVRWRATPRFLPMLMVEAVANPGTTMLLVNDNVVGEAPRWWLGAALGVNVALL